jgi:hypothetical protein
MRAQIDPGTCGKSLSGRADGYAPVVVAALVLLAAVAGGNLVVTTAPEKTRVGSRVAVRATGQVGDRGHLWIYRDRRGCAVSERGERRRGTRLVSRPIVGSFDFETSIRPRRLGRMWICGYLYALTCDAAGANCGYATGLPPDAGFSRALVRVRAQPARSAATR